MTDPARRPVGRTALVVPPLGFGAAPLGNLYRAITDAGAAATIGAALDTGLRYVDTAPYYGFGLSETRVGAALGDKPDVIVSTKVGRLLEPLASPAAARERHGFIDAMPFDPIYDYSHDGVLRSFEASLKRLGRDRIDILYVHDIGRAVHGEMHAARMAELIDGGGFAALERLRGEGAVSAVGVGVNETAVCIELMERVRLDVILLAGRYTLLEQAPLDELFPRCAAAGTSIVIGGPYNSGILALGADATGAHYNYDQVPEGVRRRVRAIERVCAAHAVALPAAALRFVLAHPLVASVIPGLANLAEVAATAAYAAVSIPPALWDDLKTEGLLRADAPVPTKELIA
jgi:D-threo-aldose 1-dehydrogenase